MFRSAYLSGLLMSHGTDSVRTSRACGKRNIEALRGTGIKDKKKRNIKKRTALSELVFNEKNEQTLLSCTLPAVIALTHKQKTKPCHWEICHFVSLKARRKKSLINVLYLESFLGGLVWEGEGWGKTKEF